MLNIKQYLRSTMMFVGYYFAVYIKPVLDYVGFSKIEDVKPLNGTKIVIINKIETYDTISSDPNELLKIKEYNHFTDWLNYSFKLSDIKPTSKSKLDFENIEFIVIDYTYNNNKYKINLNNDFSIPVCVEIKTSNLRRNILEADIKGCENLLDHEMDITQRLREYLGPNHDFCLRFPNVSDSLDYMFTELYLSDWNNLNILDSFGHNHTINLKTNKTLKWDPEFTL
jgi:hypothetical protein